MHLLFPLLPISRKSFGRSCKSTNSKVWVGLAGSGRGEAENGSRLFKREGQTIVNQKCILALGPVPSLRGVLHVEPETVVFLAVSTHSFVLPLCRPNGNLVAQSTITLRKHWPAWYLVRTVANSSKLKVSSHMKLAAKLEARQRRTGLKQGVAT